MKNKCKHPEAKFLTTGWERWSWCNICGATKLEISFTLFTGPISGVLMDLIWGSAINKRKYTKGKWKSPKLILR